MGGHRDLYGQAAYARDQMIQHRARGERLFGDLLEEQPRAGLVYLMRAEALRALGDQEQAQNDYQRAEELLVGDDWKTRAKQGDERAKAGVRNPLPLDQAFGSETSSLPLDTGGTGKPNIAALLGFLGVVATLIAVGITAWRQRANDQNTPNAKP